METISYATVEEHKLVVRLVQKLLLELGDEAKDVGEMRTASILEQWSQEASRVSVLLVTHDSQCIGLMTLYESFAIYANGRYGIIGEMYVDPEFRNQGIGRRLLQKAKEHAREHGWTRIDVTAPEGENGHRARKFYEAAGFTFAGPKLKLMVC